MAVEFQSSFIPKKEISSIAVKQSRVGFFGVLALFIFLVAIAVGAGLFVYKIVLEQRIDFLANEVKEAENALDPDFISVADRLNTRIITAQDLLKKHIAATVLFDELENLVLVPVSFSSLNFINTPEGGMKISASGVSSDYAPIVSQSDELGKNRLFRDVIFSGVNRNSEGIVQFTLEAGIDKNFILYEKLIPSNNQE